MQIICFSILHSGASKRNESVPGNKEVNPMKNHIAKITSAVLMTALLLTAACASSGGNNRTDSTTDSTTDGSVKTALVSYKATLTAQEIAAFPEAFVTGLNQYGWTVASYLYEGQNLAISPASLELAILMARTGAVGKTADEMKTALSMSALSDEEILSASRQLMWRTNSNGMEAANSLWMQKDYTFSEDFIKTCMEKFMADAFSVDFLTDAAGATDSINTWASDKTHGKIPEMNPSPLSSDTRLVLINALYFLGDWENSFAAEDTYEQTFRGTKKDADVSFMHSEENMLYAETPEYQMISLPFKGADNAADSPYSMVFILPADGQDITAVMDGLAANGFAAAAAELSQEKVQLALPKFEFTFDASMKKTMQSLGMTLAFDAGSAGFDGMTGSDNDLYISEILHKCYIRVDEEGAEAAAVTEVIMETTAMPVEEKMKTFTADRPFLFAIYDETDNSVLFLGAVGQL